jgi:SNF2 family DNA or RNA helicase
VSVQTSTLSTKTTQLVEVCKFCGKRAEEVSRFTLSNGEILKTLKCGHTIVAKGFIAEEVEEAEIDPYMIESRPPFIKRPYKYQIEGAKFLEKAAVRGMIMDEPGLGKTIQGLLPIHTRQLFPCLIICKSSLVFQIFKEIYNWFGYKHGYICQLIQKGTDIPVTGFDFYIVSYDVLRRISKRNKNAEISDINFNEKNRESNPMLNFPWKSVILDEVQAIKNPDSARTKEVREICKNVEHIICLSATPAKNHAGELFIPLNILQPSRFWNYKSFLRQHVDQFWRGKSYKLGGLRDPEYFWNICSDFLIRRKRADVMPDLPAGATRLFREVDFQSKQLEDAYKKAQEEFEDYWYQHGEKGLNSFKNANHILAMLTSMRHLTGIAKVPAVVDFLEEFISGTNRKIVVFLHHNDARDLLQLHLAKLAEEYEKDGESETAKGLKPLFLGSDLSQEARGMKVEEFRDSESRILIASTLAAGEGLNMQFCSDAIMMERQWNPANEEQAEGRFIRLGMTADHVDVHYFIASGTVDEFFTELVEIKRAAMGTIDGGEFTWDGNSLLMELAEAVAMKGGKRWKLPAARTIKL